MQIIREELVLIRIIDKQEFHWEYIIKLDPLLVQEKLIHHNQEASPQEL